MSFFTKETFLLLGGGGMIGQQIALEIARELDPQRIIICALKQQEVDQAVENIRRDFPGVGIIGVAGDVFVRREWNPPAHQNPILRAQLLENESHRQSLYEDLFLDRDRAYENSELVRLIIEYKPEVVIDSINTATAFSYQDVYAA